MLQNWIRPLSEDEYSKFRVGEGKLFEEISFFSPEDSIGQHSIALLGINDVGSLKIRKQIYQFGPLSHHIDIIDLGMARNQSEDFLTGILRELSQSKITAIIFGMQGSMLNAQILGTGKTRDPRSLAVVDIAPGDTLITEKNLRKTDRITLIGTQKHIFSPQRWIDHPGIETIRMGILKEDILESEPALRDANAVSFSIQSVNKREAPAQRNISNTKLTAYDACQLMHFLGFNQHLNSLAFTHYVPELDIQDITAHLIAQMIWYYLDARSMRTNDLPGEKDSVREFSVVLEEFGFNISFVKSKVSGKWWIRTEDGKYVSCSEKDFQLARSNTLSARVFQLFS